MEAIADSSGTIWVVLLLEDKLNFPDLQITSHRFPQKLELALSGKVADYLKTVQGSDLTAKTTSGTTLLKASGEVAAPPGVRLSSDVPSRWIGGSGGSLNGAPPPAPPRNLSANDAPNAVPKSWSLDRAGATAGFRAITSASAQTRMKDDIARLVLNDPPPGSIPALQPTEIFCRILRTR